MKAEAQVKASAPASSRLRVLDYLELTKPKISAMVLVSALTGFYMASGAAMDMMLLLHTMIGTALVGSGASALNQMMERDYDGLMPRTKNRPLPAGRLSATEALLFGLALSTAGSAYLFVKVNATAGVIGAATMLLYVLIYTPLKRITYLNTLVGAIPGALPPLIGWAAATGSAPLPAWTLFAILFFWQLPHFYAIAWLYREDYLAGGFKMISSDDPLGDKIALRLTGQIFALIAASLTPALWGMTGRLYFFLALGLGAFFLACGIMMARIRTKGSARGLLLASVIYLPLLLAAMMICKSGD